MFGLLNSQMYELQQSELKHSNSNSNRNNYTNTIPKSNQHHKMKVTTNFIDKFMKSEILTGNTNTNNNAVMMMVNNHNNGVDLKSDLDTVKNNMKNQQFNTTIPNNHNCGGVIVTTKPPSDKEMRLKSGRLLGVSGGGASGNGKINKNIAAMTGGSRIGKATREVLDKNSNEMIISASASPSPTSSDRSVGGNLPKNTETISSPVDQLQQRKKFMQMITFLDQQNQRLEKELAKEKRRRADELSRIIKSLLCFEAKLKSEKKVINHKLYEKDDEIGRLVRLNCLIKEKYCPKEIGPDGDDAEGNTAVDCKYPEAMFCPNCRLEFYGLDGPENHRTPNAKDTRNLKGDGSTEQGSSSDETLSSSFYGARRSIRYTSKRTFGTFRDYMRSRCMSIDDPNLDNSEENASTVSRDESQASYEKMNYSSTIDRIHGVRRVSSFEFDSENENRSRKNFSSSGPETDHDHSPHEEDEVFFAAASAAAANSIPTGGSNTSTRRTNRKPIEFAETSAHQDFETSTDDWYASASDPDEIPEASVRTKSYGYNAVNPVLECVNQILLQQSMEECLHETSSGATNNNGPTSLDSNENNSGGSLNGANLSGSSVASKDGTVSRKRVHFSTKNSMVHVPRDEDDNINMPASSITVIDHNHHHHHHHHHQHQQQPIVDPKFDSSLNYESIYSNEYEPIGSEHNSSNLYVDMDGSKLGHDDGGGGVCESKPLVSKQPPALPPKPANLIKFKRAIRVVTPNHLNQELTVPSSSSSKDNETIQKALNEPDYCSISEVNESVTCLKTTVADVHKVPESALSSSSASSSSSSASSSSYAVSLSSRKSDAIFQKADDMDAEIFADIPKLPNVAAIIAPKQTSKFINNDNYVTKTASTKDDLRNGPSSSSTTSQQSQQSQQQQQQHYRPKSPGQVKRQHVPNILAEINKKIQNSSSILNNNQNNSSNSLLSNQHSILMKPISPKKPNNHHHHHQQQHHHHQTLLLQPILKQTSLTAAATATTATVQPQSILLNNNNNNNNNNSSDDNNQLPIQDEFDWYNLDAEYGKSNQPDVVIKTATDVLQLEGIDELLLVGKNNLLLNNNNNNNNNNNLNNINSNSNSNGTVTDQNDSIEYNLDEEFCLGNQPDVIKENLMQIDQNILLLDERSNNDESLELMNQHHQATINLITTTTTATTNVQNGFATISDQTPQNRKSLKRKTNFVKFIDSAGLSTKPLPRQRKIYFSGPFV